MIDIKKIRETPDVIREGLRNRGANPELVDQILECDTLRREKVAAVDLLKNERNTTSKQIGTLRKAGQDTSEMQAAMRTLGEKIAALDKEASELDEKQRSILLTLPNMPAPGVVPGGKEANEVMSVWGEKPTFDFEPKNHVDLCTKLGLIDYERGVRMGGNGFWLYRGIGAQLEWAILNYFIQ
ncbi:MAG: serine--tRNA ligase, partial [Kiritimatiellia bacterium]